MNTAFGYPGIPLEHAVPGVPAFCLTNSCLEDRFRIYKEIVTDPQREVLLQRIQFTPQNGTCDDYHLFVLLAPHLGNRGMNNTAWVDEYN